MDDKLSIKLNIAERFYPLKVDRNEEERLRKAAKLLNDKILQYKQKKFTDKDTQDFIAMVALQFATKYLECEEKLDETPIIENIESINESLEQFLQEKK
jgi:cell division protein ZapA